jgi:serine protease Do
MSFLRDVARNAPPPLRDMPPVGPLPRAPAQEPEQLGGNVELKFGEHNAFLGLAFLPITEDWAREMKYPHKFGLRVERVVPGNAAEQAGIQRDDVVMKFNDRELRDTEELVKLMNDRRPGDTVGLLVFRQGKDIEVNVRLGAKRK